MCGDLPAYDVRRGLELLLAKYSIRALLLDTCKENAIVREWASEQRIQVRDVKAQRWRKRYGERTGIHVTNQLLLSDHDPDIAVTFDDGSFRTKDFIIRSRYWSKLTAMETLVLGGEDVTALA